MTDEMEGYIRSGEPEKRERAYAWSTAIGLQAVDGLSPSEYLRATACRHVEGEITVEEAQRLVRSYYQAKDARAETSATEEADKVSANIARLLTDRSFSLTSAGYVATHRRVFDGVFKHAGELRRYDITKKEWVLGGDTVLYGHWEDLLAALDYDIDRERTFDYRRLDGRRVMEHLSQFVSGLWQIHPFAEGNTRTTAVFAIKYLRSLGFDVNNELFACHSWYFRNALVRANYRNLRRGVDYDMTFLYKFFGNLLLGDCNELQNRRMLVESGDL